MNDQATGLRALMDRRQKTPDITTAQHVTQTIAITSGKGGVGKSNIALNLAIALANQNASVCVLDANLGLGNIDLLCGLSAYWNLSHVVTGARSLSEIVLEGPSNIHVVPGASGLKDLADCPQAARSEILEQMEDLERNHDFLIIDTGSGIHQSVRQFALASDRVMIVTTPEPTAIADAYALIKSLSATSAPQIHVLVNQADTPQQARNILARLQQTSRMFLKTEIIAAGYIPRDESVPAAVLQRKPFVLDSPQSAASKQVQLLATNMKGTADIEEPGGSFFSRVWRRLG